MQCPAIFIALQMLHSFILYLFFTRTQWQVYRSYNNGEVFTLEDPLREKKANSTNGSLTGSSESNGGHGEGEGEGSSGNGGSEDGTTDCTNDEESHSGSTNDSE